MTSEEFVRRYLHEIINTRVVVAGFNHHFGFRQEGDYRQLWSWRGKYGFEAEEIPEQEVQHETVSSTKIRKAISEGFIQRANAYLDHYYIVMGKPVEYECEIQFLPVNLVKIPLTEECEGLPAPGIYAVSFNSGIRKSKGMAIINRKSGDETEVLLHLFDNEPYPYNHNSIVFFHKRIHGSVDLSDQSSHRGSGLQWMQIDELIY